MVGSQLITIWVFPHENVRCSMDLVCFLWRFRFATTVPVRIDMRDWQNVLHEFIDVYIPMFRCSISGALISWAFYVLYCGFLYLQWQRAVLDCYQGVWISHVKQGLADASVNFVSRGLRVIDEILFLKVIDEVLVTGRIFLLPWKAIKQGYFAMSEDRGVWCHFWCDDWYSSGKFWFNVPGKT